MLKHIFGDLFRITMKNDEEVVGRVLLTHILPNSQDNDLNMASFSGVFFKISLLGIQRAFLTKHHG